MVIDPAHRDDDAAVSSRLRAAHARVDRTRTTYLRATGGRLCGRPVGGGEARYLLSGLVVCSVCGGSMHAIKRTGRRGAPRWYYAFFSIDPDFQTYFKVKADIDPDMDATQENIDSYAGLIQRMARVSGEVSCDDGALKRLLGIASRWAGQRDKLTSRFELIEDLVSEAALFAGKSSPVVITEGAVRVARACRVSSGRRASCATIRSARCCSISTARSSGSMHRTAMKRRVVRW